MIGWTCRPVVFIIVLIYASPLFAQHTVTNWPHNKKGAVSITFDDNNPSLLTTAVPALDSLGLKATFFLKTDVLDNSSLWDYWRDLAAAGYEFGSHSKSHSDLTSLTAAQLDQELAGSKAEIDRQIPSQRCLTLAYPYGAYNSAVQAAASQYYISARGIVNALNNTPIDFFDIHANGDDINNESAMKTWTDLAETNGAWQVIFIHSLDGAGSDYGILDTSMFQSYLNHLKSKKLWVDTYGAVVKFIKERDSSSVSVVSSSNNQIVLNLTDAMNDAIYDQPLTMRSVVPGGWGKVSIQQGGSNTFASTVIENGEPVVYYQAVPDHGSITLSPVSSQVSSLNPPSIAVGSGGFVLEATGSDFVSGSVVQWNGSARTTTFVSSTKLQAYILAADIAAQGTASVNVLHPDGTASNALLFVVNPIVPTPTTSLLSNPGFESGVSPWVFHTNTAGSFDSNAAGNGSAHAGRAIITQSGANVQLHQSGIVLEANTQYLLSFKAYSNTGHDFSVSIQKHGSPYTNYGLNQICNVGASWTDCSMSFTTSGFTGAVSDGRLMVWLAPYATAGDQYFFDDFMLDKTGVMQSPAVINQPWNQTVIAGQAATFAVAAGGHEPLHYQWQKNGIDISGATSASYTTPAAASTDSGSTFRCTIVNMGGSVTSNAATLIVLSSSLGIAAQPSNQTVAAGQTATFSVVAVGAAPLYYQWQKNGINISGATATSYTTPATVLTDSGSTFRCTISNPAGSVTSSAATLTVGTNLPVITTQPSSQTVTAGQTAMFTVMASGNGIITFQWQRNGVVISGATGNSYTTPATTLGDSGATFTCIVSSSTGSVASAAATLTVAAPTASAVSNPGFESGVTPWTFYTSGAGSFDTATAGNGSAHAGRAIITTAGSNVQLFQVLSGLEANARYRLTFAAYSNTGHDLAVSLIKSVSPYTGYGLSSYYFNLTSAWSTYSVEFTMSGFTGIASDARLMFWLATHATAGDQYYFDDVTLAKVVENHLPAITTQPVSQSVTVGQSATFSVVATGAAPLSYQWRRNGTNISGATNDSYTIPATTLADSGSAFTCMVGNTAGNISSSAATLTVTTPTTSLLSNPGFESGLIPWTFYTSGAGSFDTATAGNGSAHAGRAVITTAGSNVQLFQVLSGLEAGARDRLTFAAYSNTGRDLTVSLIKSVSPYTGYGLSGYYFNLTSSWSTYSVEFTTSGFTGTVSDARLMFWLATHAAAGDQYYFDDVTLEKVSE
jgi:peptidoglycan/xylan/chitin deacetylase (PgdA/CDA1 family)